MSLSIFQASLPTPHPHLYTHPFYRILTDAGSPVHVVFLCQGKIMERTLQPDCLSSHPSCAACYLCDLRKVTSPLCALVYSPIKGGL